MNHIKAEELKEKYGLSEGQMEKINDQVLESISGGTTSDTVSIALTLLGKGLVFFAPDGDPEDNFIDVAKLKEYFASKGYRFEPARGNEEDDLYWKDGVPYAVDMIEDLIDRGEL